MKINEEHPMFKYFYNKWQSLVIEMNKKLMEIENQNKKINYRGRDDKSTEITKEYSKLFKKLQEDYSFLYKNKS